MKKKRIERALAQGLLLSLLGCPTAGLAQTAKPNESMDYRHHGLFVHLTAGLGARFLFAGAPAQDGGPSPRLGGGTELVGLDTPVVLALGWSLKEELAVHAQVVLGFTTALRGMDNPIGASGASAGYAAVGLGATAYGITDVFATPMVSYVRMGWFDGGSGLALPASMQGVMVGLQFGKEWWLARRFLLGVTGQLDYQWLSGDDGTWHGLGVGALATLAIN